MIFLAARVGLFFLCMLCWCIWLNRKYNIPAAQTPLVAICGIGTVLYFAGLFNIIGPIQLLITLLGPVLAILVLHKDGSQAVKPMICLPVLVFGVMCLVTLMLERGRIIDAHDELAHWAIMAKSMVTDGRFPNVTNEAIEFIGYPPATALWMKYVCDFIGFSDASLYFSQSIVFLASMTALAPLCRKNWLGGIAVTVYAVYLAVCSYAYRILTVDGLLTSLCIGTIAIIAANRENLKKTVLMVLPVLVFLVITKNSGIFFVVFAALCLLAIPLDGPQKAIRRIKMMCVTIGLPLLSWWLWSKHVDLVFPSDFLSRHDVSVNVYSQHLAQKTQEQLDYFYYRFLHHWFMFDHWNVVVFWLCLAAFLLAILFLFVTKQLSARRAAAYAGGGIGMTALYLASLWGTYVFSMSGGEMTELASIGRYSTSFFDCLMGGALIMLLIRAKKGMQMQLSLICITAVMAVLLCSPLAVWPRATQKASVIAPQARQNMWLNEKEQYNLQERARYLVYTNGSPMDGWADRYVGRYALNANVLDFWQYKDEAPSLHLMGPEYDYILFLEPDELSRAELEKWGLDPNVRVLEKATVWAKQDEMAAQGLPLPE